MGQRITSGSHDVLVNVPERTSERMPALYSFVPCFCAGSVSPPDCGTHMVTGHNGCLDFPPQFCRCLYGVGQLSSSVRRETFFFSEYGRSVRVMKYANMRGTSKSETLNQNQKTSAWPTSREDETLEG